jgi:hypothetical protein
MAASSETALYQQAFNEGRRACRAGKSNIDNPYISLGQDGLEEAWNEGWFDQCDADAEAAENCMEYDF